jgi:hypothetical protein
MLYSAGCKKLELKTDDLYASQPKNDYCNKRTTKMMYQMKTNSLKNINVFTRDGSTFKTVLDKTKTAEK